MIAAQEMEDGTAYNYPILDDDRFQENAEAGTEFR
jgi:hypothetical protein